MDKVLDLSKTVYELSREYPEIVGIMQELGFKDIANPGMINTIGRFMTIPKGAVMKSISSERIIEVFKNKGFTVKE